MTAEVACEETDEEQIGQLPMFGSSQLKWYSTAAFMLRTWVQIPLKSPFFLGGGVGGGGVCVGGGWYLQLLKLQLPLQ